MGEFWSWWFGTNKKYGFTFSCTEVASAAHIYGKKIVGAEAFTACDSERWQGHPAIIKDLGDWAFCEGINRFVFHRYAMQPWLNVKPGMTMGPWGLHYERTQTWWEMSKAWHEYLARCQYLLRQGLFVADVCYLGAEASPQSIIGQKRFLAKTPDPLGSEQSRLSARSDRLFVRRLLDRCLAHADVGQGRPPRAARRHELPAAGPAQRRDDDAESCSARSRNWSRPGRRSSARVRRNRRA